VSGGGGRTLFSRTVVVDEEVNWRDLVEVICALGARVVVVREAVEMLDGDPVL